MSRAIFDYLVSLDAAELAIERALATGGVGTILVLIDDLRRPLHTALGVPTATHEETMEALRAALALPPVLGAPTLVLTMREAARSASLACFGSEAPYRKAELAADRAARHLSAGFEFLRGPAPVFDHAY